MKKQWITIGVIAVCLLMVVGIIYLIPESSKANKNGDSEKEILLAEGSSALALVKVENKTGGYQVVWNNQKAEIEGLNDIPTNDNQIQSLTENFISIKTLKTIENGKDRLNDFGLQNPEAKVIISLENKESTEILVGNSVPDAEQTGRYIYCKGEVYVVEDENLEVFFYDKRDFVSKTVSPSFEEDSPLVQKVTLERQNEEPVHITLLDSKEMAGQIVNSYQITSPIEYPARADITEDFLPSLFDITALEIAEINADEGTAEKYGLNTPYTKAKVEYTVSDSAKKEFTLLGTKQDESGYVYLQRDNVPVIYRCTPEKMTWLYAGKEELISNIVFSPDIRSLSEITINEGENTYKIQLNNIGKDNEEILCNGKKADSESFRNLYYMLISQTADEILFSEFPDTGKMEKSVQIIYKYIDNQKKDDDITYYEESTRRLYADLNNGKQGFRLGSSGMEQVLQNIEKLLTGEKIEARY